MNPQNPIKTTPKDFFLHLGAVIALYTAVPTILNLIFSSINYAFPDRLSGYFYTNSIAWPISLLIIVVPVLYVIEYFIAKDVALYPDKKGLWVWRWRIYLTLFLTAIAIIIDLVALINIYLSGEVTVRFIWKVVAVLIVTSTAFKYYFFSINEKWRLAARMRKAHAWFGVILVILAIVSGFLIVGSPTKQRNLRFDGERASDLQNIQYQIVTYWQQKQKLPTSLTEIVNPISGNYVPTDPENKTSYGYTIKGDKSFELCATFTLKMQDTSSMTYPAYPDNAQNHNWTHNAGRTCFARTIDVQIYPPYGAPEKVLY